MTTAFELDGITLAKGSHERPESGMCLLEAVAYVNGDLLQDSAIELFDQMVDGVGHD